MQKQLRHFALFKSKVVKSKELKNIYIRLTRFYFNRIIYNTHTHFFLGADECDFLELSESVFYRYLPCNTFFGSGIMICNQVPIEEVQDVLQQNTCPTLQFKGTVHRKMSRTRLTLVPAKDSLGCKIYSVTKYPL